MAYTLSSIVNELLIEMGEGQGNKFSRFFQYGTSFLRDNKFNTTGFPKIVELDINSNDTVNLPNDYVNYTRIALCCNGILYSLGKNDDICLNQNYNDCGIAIPHSVVGTDTRGAIGAPLYADNYRNGELMGRFFGIGSDNNSFGYYRVDKNTNQIHLSCITQSSTIILEYLSDIEVINNDFEVHPFAIEALKDFMFWKNKQRLSRPLGEQQLAQQNFKESNRKMRQMFASSTKDEWIAVFQSGNMGTPKV